MTIAEDYPGFSINDIKCDAISNDTLQIVLGIENNENDSGFKL
jgi:hypothetical protein